jgi:3-isopropylmalate/(R)-2-methylmalate dehydratase large subunit
MGYTLAEKILMRNANLQDIHPGDLITVTPDYVGVHDIYNESLEKKFDSMGFTKVWDPEKIIILNDHLSPCCLSDDPRNTEVLYRLQDRFGINNIFPTGGITHQIIPEQGYAKPGGIIFVTDSHTTTYGAVGCFSTGIGHTEMAYIWGMGSLWLRVPSTIQIRVEGKLPEHVYAKDIILRVLGDLEADGGSYRSLEFVGSTIDDLSIDDRLTIANMVVECGGKVGLFAADQKTADYCKMNYEDVAWVKPDADAVYERVLNYRAEDLEPYVSCPPFVDNVQPVSSVVGTCTNGRLGDLKIAAEILENKTVAPNLKFIVTPASNLIIEQAIEAGYLQTLVKAGALVTPAYCSFCEGRSLGLLGDDEVMLATNNRNFLGRYGSPKAKVYLCSPAVAAVSAIHGEITLPE